MFYNDPETAGMCLKNALLPEKQLSVCLVLKARRGRAFACSSPVWGKEKACPACSRVGFRAAWVNLSGCVLLGYHLGGFHGRLLIAHACRSENGDSLVRYKAHASQAGKYFAAGNIIPTAIDVEQINRTIPKFQSSQHFTAPPSSGFTCDAPKNDAR